MGPKVKDTGTHEEVSPDNKEAIGQETRKALNKK